MSEAKIRLSSKEAELIMNADWILTKNAILQKIMAFLGMLQEKQKQFWEVNKIIYPVEVFQPGAKISKGENYKGLPYLILDYPRYFEKESICAIRTMFWWGNFFSVTLHLSGLYKKNAGSKILSGYELIEMRELCICVNDDAWEHDFDATNYQLIASLKKEELKKLINEKPFIKLAARIPLVEWEKAEDWLLNYFKIMMGLLTD